MRIYIGGRIGTIHLAPDKFTIRQKNEIAHSLKPITKEQALNDFEKLKNVNLNEVAGGSKIGNKVVDYFTYPERLTTQGHKGLSYYDVLSNTKEYLKKPHIAKVEKYIKAHNINVTHYQLWKEIFQVYFSSINIFKPLIAMEFYTKYKL